MMDLDPTLLMMLGGLFLGLPFFTATFQGNAMSNEHNNQADNANGGGSMWHHKTKLGTFWIVESEDNHQYYVGLDEESIGCYQRLEDAIEDIRSQSTGNIKWDGARHIEIPDDVVHQWDQGEPDNWDKF